MSDYNQEKHDIYSDPLAIIYNEGQWRLNKVSALNNLNFNVVKLKQYASKIRQALVSAIPANSLKYSVLIEEQPYLKYCPDDSSGLLLTVSSSQENQNISKVAYSAIFLSWGVSSKLENATHLPYMLEKGEQKVGNAVRSVLQTLFDCIIQQFSFSQHQLLHFGFSFLEIDTSRNSDPFTLTFKTPQVEHKDKLNMSLDIGDVRIIWNGLKEEVKNNSEQIKLAYQILQNQIFHMVMLDISVFDLYEVTLPKAEVKNSGIVKMKTPEAVNCVFTVLNEITPILSV
ncbi:unnamed protein product [Chilo suppressalis]|uniref:Centromere protein L n=1 Tax=Chilo suppressalis TaxID=168631 RepID=A0ABN8B617_CHISP|nr:hypothetical protein evm_007066 [Chilo suppressalis]CAH0401278.1 unnamed protein product [Chilo suppressalis]